MRRHDPLITVIVTTYNNHGTLAPCLQSVREQTYTNVELIVVDNSSSDDTKAIARTFTDRVYNWGPERSAQRNYGVQLASGEYVVIIDSDMELTPRVVQACVEQVRDNPALGSLVIPEESFGKGFWAQCKRLERSFYIGISHLEAARFYRRDLYVQAGGYDTEMVSGEDWDLSRRIGLMAPQGRIDDLIRHNEGKLSLARTLGKKYYYASLARGYLEKNQVQSKISAQEGPLQRYRLFLSKPGKLFRNPVLGMGVLFMKTCEFAAGALGYYVRPQKENA